MNKMTIWQRLNTALTLLIVLLLAGVGLALWVCETRSTALHQQDQLSGAGDRVQRDVILLSESLRRPKNELGKRHRQNAEHDLKVTLETFRAAAANSRDLTAVVNGIRDYAFNKLADLQKKLADLGESDLGAMGGYYGKNYPALSLQRDQLFRDLDQAISSVNEASANAAQKKELAGMIAIGMILLASLLVGRLQSAAVSEPLSRLVATLERMRQGDFTERLQWNRNDEFGVLSKGLNRLADDLSALVAQVQRSGIQVNTTTTEISASAKQQQSTAHEIATTTAHIGTTSKQISATTRELLKTMNEVNQVAEQTASLAGSGQTAIARMEPIMRQIIVASSSITAKLAVLNDKTSNINSVVTTITKVADQTNLLSLNAAIEAEKAGEYGLGFAVVAVEIRRLADQTAVATFDIERMVKEMQSAVAAGVMGMDRFSEEVRRGADEIRHVSAQLAQIINQVQTLTPRFQAVNEGMHAQASGAEQISDTLDQLSQAAQQTADSLRRSNQAIEQLNGAALGLQTSVARFKLQEP